MRWLRGLWWPFQWRLNQGTELERIPDPTQPAPQTLTVVCLHPPGCWSYCTGGYRYCLCCMKVRVRC